MDVLEQVSDSDPDASGSSSSSESEDEGAGPAPEQKKQKITFEDLEQRGYKTGPSVIYMKAPQEQQEENWNWWADALHLSMNNDANTLCSRV
jgi:hypothetical protein